MRIRVPIAMLQETASIMSETENVLGQNDKLLNKAWNGLQLEAKSKITIDYRIKQSQSIARNLIGQANAMKDYLDRVGSKFAEADRKCSDGLSKARLAADGKPYYTVSKNEELQSKQRQSIEEYNRLTLGLEKDSSSVFNNALPWIGAAAGFYGGLSFLPYHKQVEVFSKGVGYKEKAGSIVNGMSGDEDLYDVGGAIGAVLVTTAIASKIGTAVAIAVGGALVTKAAFVTAPLWVPMVIGIGVGIVVKSAVSSLLHNVSISGNSFSDHMSGNISDSLRSTVDFYSKVGPKVVRAGASSVIPILQSVHPVGRAVRVSGRLVKGLGKLFNL